LSVTDPIYPYFCIPLVRDPDDRVPNDHAAMGNGPPPGDPARRHGRAGQGLRVVEM
jgi:hypothetical protein